MSSKEPSVGDRVIMSGWIIMGLGGVLFGAVAGGAIRQNYPQVSLDAYTPFIMFEGIGLTLNGVGVQLNTAPDPSLQDKFNIAGRLLLGLGITSLSLVPVIPDQLILKLATGTLITSGAVCLGIAEDKANLLKWSQA